MDSDRIIEKNPTIGDERSRALATRLHQSAHQVTEPQRSRILTRLPRTLFISHSSADDAFIKGAQECNRFPQRDSIWWICGEVFYDPFYHSIRTGGAKEYERIVGLSLLASKRILVIWSENALRSDYVRAELLMATENDKELAGYLMPDAPGFPIANVKLVKDNAALRALLIDWRV